MQRTSVRDLVAVALVVAAVVYLILRRYYGSMPPLEYVVVTPFAALAVGEVVAARRVRAAVTHQAGARPMAALVIARCLALAKASAILAAGLLGAVVGLALRVLPDVGEVEAARHDAMVGGLAVLVALALLVAALLLERATLDPSRR
ncbi:MAG: DUF3180 domain-containing protein [bacterium]